MPTAILKSTSGGRGNKQRTFDQLWWIVGAADEGACELGPETINQSLDALDLPLPEQAYTDLKGGNPLLAPGACDLANLFTFVQTYSYGQTTVDEHGTCYTPLTITFGQTDPTNTNESPDNRPEGETSDIPEDWAEQVSSNSVERLRAQAHMEFLGLWQEDQINCQQVESSPATFEHLQNSCITQLIGDCVRPSNAAGEPFIPLPDLEDSDWVHSITMYRSAPAAPNFRNIYDFQPYVRTINEDRITFEVPKRRYQITIPARAGRLRSVTIEAKTHATTDPATGEKKNIGYFELRFEIAHRPEGWDVDLLNAGARRCAAPGSPDRFGGLFDAAGQKEAQVSSIAIEDKDGHAVSTPSPLDDQGQPLREATDGVVDPDIPITYLRYGGFVSDWKDIPDLKDLIFTPGDVTVTLVNKTASVSIAGLGGTSGSVPTIKTTDVATIDWQQGTLTLSGPDAALFSVGGNQLWLKSGVVLTIGVSLNVTVTSDDSAASDSLVLGVTT